MYCIIIITAAVGLYAVDDHLALLFCLLLWWYINIVPVIKMLGVIVHIIHTKTGLSVAYNGFVVHETSSDHDDSRGSV